MQTLTSIPSQAAPDCCVHATFRDWSKRAAEHVLLGGAGAARLGRGWLRSTLVLAYHNIVPRGEEPAGERSLHLPQAAFGAQLDALCRTHDVVGLETAMTAGRRGSRPKAVITFDDAYRGAVTAGIEEVSRRGLPATIFVSPGFIPSGAFWWDTLADPGGELRPDIRRHGLEELGGLDERIRAWAKQAGWSEHALPAHAHAASIEELEAAVGVRGITLGSHTWSHCNLARTSPADAERELRTSLAWLRSKFRSTIPWLSYPYGLASPEVAGIARDLGYEGAVRIDGGWLRDGETERFEVPRLNVPSGLSDQGFRLRASGVLWH